MSENEKVSSMENVGMTVKAEAASAPATETPVTIVVAPQPAFVAPQARKMRFAALFGFSLGVLGTVGYLLAGGHYFFFPFGCLWVDRFAFIAFSVPGHLAAFDLRIPGVIVKVVCVFLVGLTWGSLAVLARRAWLAAKFSGR